LLYRSHILSCRSHERLNFILGIRIHTSELACPPGDFFEFADLADIHGDLNGLRAVILFYSGRAGSHPGLHAARLRINGEMDFQLRIARQAAIAKHSFPRINVFSGAFAHPEFGALKEDGLVVGKQYINIRAQVVIAGFANAVDD
jgi:hypothetical protein